MDSPDLDGLFHNFDDKISNVCSKLAFLSLHNSQSREDCVEMNKILGNIQFMLLNMNNFLQQQEELLEYQSKRCDNLFSLLSDQSAHVESKLSYLNDIRLSANVKCNNSMQNKEINPKNMSIKQIKQKEENPKIITKSSTENKFSKATKKPSVKKEFTPCVNDNKPKSAIKPKLTEKRSENIHLIPEMSPIAKSEFDSIPSYMLGRLTLEVLNECVCAFNTTIREKYNFINSYSTQQSESDYKRFQTYKSHENSETKGTYFCIVNDIKELSSMKNDSTIRKVLICFRHCKKIKEIRGNPQKLVRYGLID